MGRWTASEESFIDTEISEAMADAGVAHDSPLKQLLLRDAQISTSGALASVRIPDEHGRPIPIADKLSEMKGDARWRHHFPVGPATVSKLDLRTMADHFAEIASGQIKVV